jgi:2-phospho-L-lactate guanylyltransferase
MINWALIPVKSFDVGKSRLRKIFSLQELTLLNISLFQSTFLKVKDSGQFAHILVISRDVDALEWTKANHGEALCEEGDETLNSALAQGLGWIALHGAGSVLILPVDIPLLTVDDFYALHTYQPKDPGMLIVPDHTQLGTNALLLTRPDLLKPQFGPNSFQLHCAQAEQAHVHQTIYLNKRMQQDIDTPDDLALIQQIYLLDSPIGS